MNPIRTLILLPFWAAWFTLAALLLLRGPYTPPERLSARLSSVAGRELTEMPVGRNTATQRAV